MGQKEGNTRQITNIGTRDQGLSTKRSVSISCLFVHRSACRSAVGLVNIGSKEKKITPDHWVWYEHGDFPSRNIRWSRSPAGIKSQSRDSSVSLTPIKLSHSPYSCFVSGKKISSTCSFVARVKWGESLIIIYLSHLGLNVHTLLSLYTNQHKLEASQSPISFLHP